ncbi:MAG: MFS transporter [Haloarculaceae archaeon]
MPGFETFLGEDAQAVRDRAFQVLLANLTAPLGPALVSPLLDTLTGVYGVSEAEIDLMVSAYTAPGIVVIPVVGVLTDRYGRKSLLSGGLFLFGCAGVALTLATDFRAVLALRVLQGVGGAAIVPVIITSVGDFYVGATEATAQGLRLSTSGVTQAVFPAIAGVLVVAAWQYPLLLYAIAIPIAGVVFVRLEEPRGARSDGGWADPVRATPTTRSGLSTGPMATAVRGVRGATATARTGDRRPGRRRPSSGSRVDGPSSRCSPAAESPGSATSGSSPTTRSSSCACWVGRRRRRGCSSRSGASPTRPPRARPGG